MRLLIDTLLFVLFIFLIGSLFQALFMGRRRIGSGGGSDSLKETQAMSRRNARYHGLSESQEEEYADSLTLGVCFSRFALQVAAADGILTQVELLSILNFFRSANPAYLQHLQEVLMRDIANPASIDWQYNLAEARRILSKPKWEGFTDILFDGLLRISLADGRASQAEVGVIFSIMENLGWSRSKTQSWFQSRTRSGFNGAGTGTNGGSSWRGSPFAASSIDEKREAREILGVSETATLEEIKKRYRALVREHHPDRYAQMGEEMQKSASTRFQAIQKAWETLSKN